MSPELDQRGIVARSYDTRAEMKKSPFVEGFLAGVHAAAYGAPMGAGVQALRGGSLAPGIALGALVPGLMAGLAAASKQKLRNLKTESELRYHAGNIRDREPGFFLPPAEYLEAALKQRGK